MTMNYDNFANHPVSVAEHLSDKVDINAAAVWSPRDVLIRTLRELDSGKINPVDLIVAYRQKTDQNEVFVSFKQATSDRHITIGMILEVIALISA